MKMVRPWELENIAQQLRELPKFVLTVDVLVYTGYYNTGS